MMVDRHRASTSCSITKCVWALAKFGPPTAGSFRVAASDSTEEKTALKNNFPSRTRLVGMGQTRIVNMKYLKSDRHCRRFCVPFLRSEANSPAPQVKTNEGSP